MSQGPSYSWFSFPTYAPLSGAVTQTFQNYQGVPEIELAVITEAGSFGSQLGALTKVVLELARLSVPDYKEIERRTLEELEKNAEVIKEKKSHLEQLIILDKLVDDIKERHRRAAERDARRALEQLKKFDDKRYASFVKTL